MGIYLDLKVRPEVYPKYPTYAIFKTEVVILAFLINVLVFPGFMEKDGKPYCPRDFYHLFAPKCSGCGESVKENYLSAANGTWHPDCFVCAVSEYEVEGWNAIQSFTA